MAKTEKLDLYKEHKAEYAAAKAPKLVEVGPARYLTIAGRGEPGGEDFTAKVGALYSVAFTIKMTRKFAGLHHEIYLSDPRRVAPERLRTILRNPVRKRKDKS